MRTSPTKPEASVIDIQKQVGAAIRSARKAEGISLRDLEGLTGIARSNLSFMENGKINITLDTLIKICNAINRSPKITFL